MTARTLKILFALACLLMVGLRVYDLTSDNSFRIDFSLGQLTDESYYTMNAKNMALFGQERLDGFNNMLLSPALHFIHELNFRLFGVGTEQARLVSVVFGLLTVGTLFWALFEAAGLRLAIFGAVLLGLEHLFVLFNRQALMDTPSCFPAMLALLCFVKAAKTEGSRGWLIGCGLSIAAAVTTRNQQAGLILAPFLSLVILRRPKSDHLWVAAGLISGLAVYAIAWFLPHRSEIMHMNTYYRLEQWGPKSLKEVVKNVAKALLRPEGEVGYFVRHGLITIIGVFAGLLAVINAKRIPSMSAGTSALACFAGVAFVAMASSFALISYAPGRYLMIMLPPMVALATVGYSRLPEIDLGRAQRWAVLILATAITYHLLSVLLEAVPVSAYAQRGTGFKIVVRTLASLALVGITQVWFSKPVRWVGLKSVACAFLLMQVFYMGDWLTHRTHLQLEFGRWAAKNLPADAVVINGVYLGLEGRSHILQVLPRLCNDDHPIQRNLVKPLYIVVSHLGPEGPPKILLGDTVPTPNLIQSTQLNGYTLDLYRLGR